MGRCQQKKGAAIRKSTFLMAAPFFDGNAISDGGAPFLMAASCFDGSAQNAVLPHGSIICPRFPVRFPGKGHAAGFALVTENVTFRQPFWAGNRRITVPAAILH